MNIDLSKIGVVILAAGKGARLNCTDKPKVMLEIGGKPIVSYIVETLIQAGFSKKQICLVVGFQEQKVRDYFGDRVSFVTQKEQLGTAHAAHIGIKSLPKEIETVLVLGGDDSAFYTRKTLLDFIKKHNEVDYTLSLLSAVIEDPTMLGRIVRYPDKSIAIVEKEYLSEEEKDIKEISTGTFCFDRKWFEEMFPDMPKLKKLGEWGLPTALAIARGDGKKYRVVKLEDSREWLGINTILELEKADFLKKNNSTPISTIT
ncbi:NTP transferase domain-containing protein [Patescibacteria group bacterium]|nr:NTP transferase domain-containing protein [Patescibacteria group bacterium]